jgi:hypothetical protein
MSSLPVPPELHEVIPAFPLPGRLVSAAPHGSGHINETYAAVFAEGAGTRRYVFQKINHRIFKNVPGLMDNVRRVTAHIAAKVRATGGDAAARRVLTLVPARDGRAFTQARAVAAAFGEFQAQLADLPGGRLFETIPNFHHTRSRFENFRRVVVENTAGRKAGMAAEIEFAFSREADADVLLNLLARGEISERVTHNDTKINNVMLDDATGRTVAVIDLDTIMPGLPLYDFGEMVRTSASSTLEDDPDAGNMRVLLPPFRALVEGYLASAVGGVLNATERAHLGFAGKLMTYENGLRFLTDYLQGDTYYKIKHPRHNLDRCRTQFALVRSIEASQDAMTRIIEEQAKMHG